jgi:Fur family transcriptional regulator, peroxide stress response regulator
MSNETLSVKDVAAKLTQNGLKVTPQRIALLQALYKFQHHPTAEEIFREVQGSIPGLSATTVYNILDVFVDKGITHRIATSAGVMRYDAVSEPHHHLYDAGSNRVEDFFDPELDRLLEDYFKEKKIMGFRPHQIRLQMTGEFL